MRLYVMRHGESENNLRKCWTGWFDAELTDKGRSDARKAGELLRGVTFDKIYTSDLHRAVETAEIALPGCSYETTPLLREVDLGSLANKPLSFPEGEVRTRMFKEGYQLFGGESFAEFHERLGAFLRQVEEQNWETVAAFCHAGCLRTLLRLVADAPIPVYKFYCRNCAVAVFEYSGGSWGIHSWINLD